MAASVEVLILGNEAVMGRQTLEAAASGANEAGLDVEITSEYRGRADWLCVYAASQLCRRYSVAAHIKHGGKVACWDAAYFGRGADPEQSYMRVSVNDHHPWRDMDRTPNDGARFAVHGIVLREDADRAGPIIVAGVGGRKRQKKGRTDWEPRAVQSLRKRFPGRKIVFRPKPGLEMFEDNFGADERDTRPIEDVLRGASLLICTHSNVALDACIAGVPVECSDGAAYWLYRRGREQSAAARRDLLHRVCWWQWRLPEMAEAWKFLTSIRD